MKKGMKITALIAVLLVVAGIVIIMISGGYSTLSQRIKGIDKESVLHEYVSTETVKNINVDVVNSKIIVVRSKVKTLNASYTLPSDIQYKIENKNNTFSITEKKFNFNFFDFKWILNMFRANEKMTIEIPKNLNLSDVKISTINGEIIIGNNSEQIIQNKTDGFQISTLKAETVNGKITIKKVSATDINIKTTNGEQSIENCFASNLRTNSVNGRINMWFVNASKISSETVNGSIDLSGTVNILNLKTVNGSMTFDDFNGKPSDYSIKFNSVNGSLFIDDKKANKGYYWPENNKGKSITADTVNGSLHINSFDKKDIGDIKIN